MYFYWEILLETWKHFLVLYAIELVSNEILYKFILKDIIETERLVFFVMKHVEEADWFKSLQIINPRLWNITIVRTDNVNKRLFTIFYFDLFKRGNPTKITNPKRRRRFKESSP